MFELDPLIRTFLVVSVSVSVCFVGLLDPCLLFRQYSRGVLNWSSFGFKNILRWFDLMFNFSGDSSEEDWSIAPTLFNL